MRLRTVARALFGLAALLLLSAPAAAKSYSADRFDSVVRVLPNGDLDVTETVVFSFTEGTFREVFRELPLKRTDGIEVLRAEMQGERLPFGSEMGTVEVTRRNGRVRILWRFRPIEQVTREFVLNYRVKGVVRQEDGADVLVWRGTPGEHRYAIASSAIRFELPVAPQGEPGVTTRKTARFQVGAHANVIDVAAQRIGANGWVDTGIRFPPRSVAVTAPLWQQRAAHVDASAPKWLLAAGAIFTTGIVLLAAWRNAYDVPPRRQSPPQTGFVQPPDDLGPALVGALSTNGRPMLEHAMAAVFAMAERGELEIEEKPRGMFGTRAFEVTRKSGRTPLAPHQARVLEVIFRNQTGGDERVSLSQARNRLVRRWRPVAAAIQGELEAAGFIDSDRRRLRSRYSVAGVGIMVLAGIAVASAIPLVEDNGPWPLVIALALLLLAFAAFIFSATITPLSNEGVRRGQQWRDYQQYLKQVASGEQPGVGVAQNRVLPYAVALGLASAWAKFTKSHPHTAPAWFRAVSADHHPAAFAAFIADGGAGATSGAHGGAGAGAAGGGASGAH